MSLDNARRVDSMTEEEREKHRAEILDQLGPGVDSLIRKAQEARRSHIERMFLIILSSIRPLTPIFRLQ